jgi:glutathione synthase/RimK-type ligase-like ATP-grasp enzyme
LLSDLGGRRLKLLLLNEASQPPVRNVAVVEEDALRLEDELSRQGHEVTRVGAAPRTEIFVATADGVRLANGATIDLASFDGALFCAPPSVPWRAPCESLLTDRGVFVFQDFETSRAASDKLRSFDVFNANGIPTPRTLGFYFDRPIPPGDLSRFLETIDSRPYVVKKSYGWSGHFVRFPLDAEEAESLVWDWHRENVAQRKGGVLAQEFIDSGEERKCDYRVHTLVTRDSDGNIEPQLAAAFLRVAPPGRLITNFIDGAERRRMALDFEEGERFYVGKCGLTRKDYRQRVESGAISLLPKPIAALALKTAVAFGLGYLGQDIMVRRSDDQPFLLEVNPTVGAKPLLEREDGFDIYRRWAAGFARTVAFEKARRR